MQTQNGYALVLSTVPSVEIGRKIARDIVESRLAACVNLVPNLTSVYEWEDKLQEEPEVLLIIKTTSDLVERLRARIAEIHPYAVPEIIAIPIMSGHEKYLEWIQSVTCPCETREDAAK